MVMIDGGSGEGKPPYTPCVCSKFGDSKQAAYLESALEESNVYKALSGDRSPGIDTILKVIGALGIKLHAEART